MVDRQLGGEGKNGKWKERSRRTLQSRPQMEVPLQKGLCPTGQTCACSWLLQGDQTILWLSLPQQMSSSPSVWILALGLDVRRKKLWEGWVWGTEQRGEMSCWAQGEEGAAEGTEQARTLNLSSYCTAKTCEQFAIGLCKVR